MYITYIYILTSIYINIYKYIYIYMSFPGTKPDVMSSPTHSMDTDLRLFDGHAGVALRVPVPDHVHVNLRFYGKTVSV